MRCPDLSAPTQIIQNADDAGAKELKFCIDRRTHPSGSLYHKRLSPFQGPALLAFNDAVFTDVDFQSIQRIGDSLKKATSKGGKTGRFGVGFNSVYHLTDVPAFVSGSNLVMFDPHASHLPNVNPANPGKLIKFTDGSGRKLVEAHPDQVGSLTRPWRHSPCTSEVTTSRRWGHSRLRAQHTLLTNRAHPLDKPSTPS